MTLNCALSAARSAFSCLLGIPFEGDFTSLQEPVVIERMKSG